MWDEADNPGLDPPVMLFHCQHMRPLIALLAATLTGCALNPALAPDLSLHDRFVLNALTDDSGDPVDVLLKWSWPLIVSVEGDQTHYADVERQVRELGEITGLHAEMAGPKRRPNMVVTFGSRAELQRHADTFWQLQDYGSRAGRFTCFFLHYGSPGGFRTNVFIREDLPAEHIRRCLAQELAQGLGPGGDIDGRTDTVFTSFGSVDHLTAADRQVLRVLYDDRLHTAMSRADVLAILPAIVAGVKAEQQLR